MSASTDRSCVETKPVIPPGSSPTEAQYWTSQAKKALHLAALKKIDPSCVDAIRIGVQAYNPTLAHSLQEAASTLRKNRK